MPPRTFTELVRSDLAASHSSWYNPRMSPRTLDRAVMLSLVCEDLRRGATLKAAATKNGIHRDTLYGWQEQDADVADMISRAQAEFLASVEIKFGDDALNGDDWRARESLLKRRDREQWGDKLDLTGIPESVLVELLGGGRAATPRAQIADKGVIEGQVDPQNPNRYIPLSQQIRTRRMQKRRAERDGNSNE